MVQPFFFLSLFSLFSSPHRTFLSPLTICLLHAMVYILYQLILLNADLRTIHERSYIKQSFPTAGHVWKILVC